MSKNDLIVHLDDKDVDANLNLLVDHYGKPVLIFVYADWCGHCTHAKPNVLKLKNELEEAGTGIVVAVDSDKSPQLTRRLRVDGYPSFFLVKAKSNALVNISNDVGDRSCNALRQAMQKL